MIIKIPFTKYEIVVGVYKWESTFDKSRLTDIYDYINFLEIEYKDGIYTSHITEITEDIKQYI